MAADDRPGAQLVASELEREEAPASDALRPASAPAPRATAELLSRLIDDLTYLVQTPEAKHLKRNHSAFVDALKRVDYVRPFEGDPS
jgi:hypothetical protein